MRAVLWRILLVLLFLGVLMVVWQRTYGRDAECGLTSSSSGMPSVLSGTKLNHIVQIGRIEGGREPCLRVEVPNAEEQSRLVIEVVGGAGKGDLRRILSVDEPGVVLDSSQALPEIRVLVTVQDTDVMSSSPIAPVAVLHVTEHLAPGEYRIRAWVRERTGSPYSRVTRVDELTHLVRVP